MSQALPAAKRRNIFLFYILTAFCNLWFLASNWIYFWTKFMTFGQLGIIDGLAFGFSLLLDVPAGALADLLGKKRMVVIALTASSIGTFFIASAQSWQQIFIGWMITQFGFAFYSGSMEALTYDTLLDLGEEERYQAIISRNQIILLVVAATCTFFGGFLYVIHERIPQYLWFVGNLLALITSFFLIEPTFEKKTFSIANYFGQLSTGLKELLHPKLRRYFLFFFILLGTYYMFSWGFVKPAMATSFGFHAKEQSVIFALLTLLSAGAVGLVPKLRNKISDFVGILIITAILAIAFLYAALPVGYLGVISLFAIVMGGEMAYPWISTVINHSIPSQYRTTTLSTISLLSKIPYVLVAILAGAAVENGKLTQFDLGVGIILLLGMVVSIGMHYTAKLKAVHN